MAKLETVPVGPDGRPEPWTRDIPDNVKVQVMGDVLVLTVDLRKDFGASATGKTNTVASTHGMYNLETHPGVMISLNVNRKRRA